VVPIDANYRTASIQPHTSRRTRLLHRACFTVARTCDSTPTAPLQQNARLSVRPHHALGGEGRKSTRARTPQTCATSADSVPHPAHQGSGLGQKTVAQQPPVAASTRLATMEREPLVEPPPARKKNTMMPNFDPEEPDCMTLVLMGEHIDPKELAELSDQGCATVTSTAAPQSPAAGAHHPNLMRRPDGEPLQVRQPAGPHLRGGRTGQPDSLRGQDLRGPRLPLQSSVRGWDPLPLRPGV